MFFLEDKFIFSASDLSISVDCNYQSLYLLDVKLGRRPGPMGYETKCWNALRRSVMLMSRTSSKD